jgi:glycosyltransferase involved in cell wall biosynthesis
VLFLVRSFGFPEGMAATYRLRLLGRALIAQGVRVRVLCTRVTELPDDVRNDRVAGVCDGIPFRYTPGTTIRSASFLLRRYREARGYMMALLEILQLRNQGSLDCVCLAALPRVWAPSVWLMIRILRMRHIPVIADLNEIPRIWWRPSPPWSQRVSPLSGLDGVVSISSWLSELATADAARAHRQLKVVEIPVLVDLQEQTVTPYPTGAKDFVYSASAVYHATVLPLLLRAMQRVWARHPQCRLIVTGWSPSRFPGLGAADPLAEVHDGRILTPGYVARHELLSLYRDSAALLIPMSDDPISRARFPTKIAEYLASARPVVTTKVGEVDRFLVDGESAFMSPPGDADAYAECLIEILDNPTKAAAVGMAGRALTESLFRYEAHGPALLAFISAVCASSSSREKAEG